MATIKTFGKEYSYVLECEKDKPEDEQTVWYYKLPSIEAQVDEGEEITVRGDLMNEKSKDYSAQVKSGSVVKQQVKIIKSCLTRVEKLLNDNGETVDWPINTRSKDNNKPQSNFLASIPPTWRAELAKVFRSAATIGGEEVKN